MPKTASQQAPARIPVREVGKTGLNQYDGRLEEEELRALQDGPTRRRIYKEMASNDAVIGAILFCIDMLLRQVDRKVEPFDDSPEALKHADWLSSVCDDMSSSWSETVSEILSFLVYGFGMHEICYKYRRGQNTEPGQNSRFNDGLIGWRKLPIRSQDSLDRWIFDKEGGVAAMVQSPPPDYEEHIIPIQKALLFRTKVYKGSPEGQSILRSSYVSWYRKKNLEEFEAIGFERDLTGLPMLTVPAAWTDSGATTDEKAAFADAKSLVTSIKQDEQAGIVIPAIFDTDGNQELKFELISAKGTKGSGVDKAIQRYDQRIAMTVLADFLLLGSKNVGSWAMFGGKTNLFSSAADTFSKMISSTINRHGVPRLFTLNGWPIDKLPQITFGSLRVDDPAILAEFVSKLTAAGMDFSDPDTVNYLRRLVAFPELSKEQIEAQKKEKQEMEQAAQEQKQAAPVKEQMPSKEKKEQKKETKAAAEQFIKEFQKASGSSGTH